MGLLDDIGDQVAKHSDKIDDAIDRGGDFIDSKTDGKYADKVDRGQDFLRDKADDLSGRGNPRQA